LAEILTNSRARHEYHILATYEAGIALRGTEVKSLRAGLGQLRDAFARVENGELWLHNVHIEEYSHGNLYNHAPRAPRKLLLHKSELRKLTEASAAKGCALIPLSFYWKNNRVKVALAVCQGRMEFDKRQDTRKRDAEREVKRATMHRLKGR
jgi:SsrA-binding protein